MINQWEIATGYDCIPMSPYFPSCFKSKPEFSRPNAERLGGWAFSDPDKSMESNPLLHECCLEYWKTHDPECKHLANLLRQDI